jgi:hypothetical protein
MFLESYDIISLHPWPTVNTTILSYLTTETPAIAGHEKLYVEWSAVFININSIFQ